MRTSPTNIGLQLLATASAHQLGFISAETMVTRLERAFDSMDRLRKFRGHLYNWYDLHDLRVLEPAYISTVDSGNLAGHLIALRQACLARIEEPPVDLRIGRGLDTGLALALERLLAPGAKRTHRSARRSRPPPSRSAWPGRPWPASANDRARPTPSQSQSRHWTR